MNKETEAQKRYREILTYYKNNAPEKLKIEVASTNPPEKASISIEKKKAPAKKSAKRKAPVKKETTE